MMSITATLTDTDSNPRQRQSQCDPAPAQRRDERRLLQRLAGGDQSAAGTLVEQTYGTIYAALFRLCGGDAELAADLTQESYRRAWASLAGYRGRSRFATWLYRIAYNTFLNHIRRPQLVVGLHPETADTIANPGSGQDEVLVRQEHRQQLRRAVLDLPEPLRLTVTARYWVELPVREIAAMLEISEVAVRKRLKKALQMLSSRLEVVS
jgi:RNA polymerase sigma-70 factor (ECF subfamily)